MKKGLERGVTDVRDEALRSQISLAIAERALGVGGDVKRDHLFFKPNVQGKSCREFVGASDAPLSPVIGWAAERLSALQKERGVKIFLTWPSVAGTDCYDPLALESLSLRIRALFEGAGITVVSQPARSLFPVENMLDTYNHIGATAARIRTNRLIEDLRFGGLEPQPAIEGQVVRLLGSSALSQEETRMLEHVLKPPRAGDYKPGSKEFSRYFYLPPDGWQQNEDWGIWSKGSQSAIAFLPPKERCTISLDVQYAQEDKPTEISLDGGQSRKLDGAPFSTPTSGRLVRIRLQHSDAKSPKQMGVSDDIREIALGLKKIVVDCVTQMARDH